AQHRSPHLRPARRRRSQGALPSASPSLLLPLRPLRCALLLSSAGEDARASSCPSLDGAEARPPLRRELLAVRAQRIALIVRERHRVKDVADVLAKLLRFLHSDDDSRHAFEAQAIANGVLVEDR